MKTLFFIGLIISTAVHSQTRKIDSVYYYMKEIKNGSGKLVRSPILDKACDYHAKWLISKKQIGHTEFDNPNMIDAKKRAQNFGDTLNSVWYEVVWAGGPYVGTSIKESIMYFEKSKTHWMMLTSIPASYKINSFGYSRIRTEDYDVCVILYAYQDKHYISEK